MISGEILSQINCEIASSLFIDILQLGLQITGTRKH